MRVGLVLEGGAMRGMYTCGVIDVLMENGIVFDGVIGVSAGAVFGCNYKSKQVGRAIRYNKRFCGDKRYMSIRNLLTTGDLYGREFCYKTIPEKLDLFDTETFEKNKLDFYVVATDVKNGEPIYYKCHKGDAYDIKWMRASASMPFVSQVVKIDNYELLDGGLTDSIPFEWFIKQGYARNIVVKTQVANYRKKHHKMLWLVRLFFLRRPIIAKLLIKRYKLYNEQLRKLRELEQNGDVLVIEPSEYISIKRLERNADKLQQMYDLGRRDAIAKMGEIRQFLSK